MVWPQHTGLVMGFNEAVSMQLADMRLNRSVQHYLAVDMHVGGGRIKQADWGLGPRIPRAQATNQPHRPTVVLVAGLSEGHLREEAMLWLNPDQGSAHICFTATIQHFFDRRDLKIDKWQRDRGQSSARITESTVISEDNVDNVITVSASPLTIQFDLLFNREPNRDESDILVEEQELREIADLVSLTKPTQSSEDDNEKNDKENVEEGAMARRLSQMTEDALLEGGSSARRNIQHAGFSEDLKQQLEERVKAASFKSEYAAAHSVLDMPSSAGQGTREAAAAPTWTGTESLQDSALRMLDDASKPIRTPFKIPNPVNLQPAPKSKHSPGVRIAKAKERTSNYAMSQTPGLSEEEREEIRNEMRERLNPGARNMPISIQGLSSLANERIEDAIARGQFEKIKRGKGVNTETDHNANSAYIDTTEYFMNKIIQKQEIVPPWIEKQQELATEISRFRQRIRADWRRQAARLISSQGGSLEAQMQRARGHAAAEARLLEKDKLEAALRNESASIDGEVVVSEIATDGRIVSKIQPDIVTESQVSEKGTGTEEVPHLPPLRDPQYMSIERSYHELAVKRINSMTRSYNLQAPRSAQKPYVNLDRELKSCFADVAPSLAEEIKRRATERARVPASSAGSSSSVFGSIGPNRPLVRVHEEGKDKAYGLKQMWRDLFSKEG
ncbi:hypothetical protein N7456_003103 [Penicillium angulare]|uniref:DnaJ homologue subfamily C member 28 conserved domain-containing protein n=1 Tax=Penicillium angulare TaxID=116970 RepID=A0A9W9FU47_9EURO|nr:hypothetical protein N7456_003103 [Penicillium angulare]